MNDPVSAVAALTARASGCVEADQASIRADPETALTIPQQASNIRRGKTRLAGNNGQHAGAKSKQSFVRADQDALLAVVV